MGLLFVIFCIQVSIPSDFVCDMIINCDDSSDEMDCDISERFYCENRKPLFVPIRKVNLDKL